MEVERRKHERYEWKIKALLIYSGLWINVHPMAKMTMACIAFFSNFMVAMSVMNFCIHHRNNIIILTKGMSMMIGMFTICLKIVIFIRYKDDMTYLDQNLTAKYFEDMKDPENRPHLLAQLSLYSKFFWVATLSVFLATNMYIVISFVAFVKHGKYVRIFPVIYPFIGKPVGIIHWFFFFFEVIAGSFLVTITAGVDCCFGMYSYQMCGEFRVLAHKFQSLKAAADYKALIKDCVQRHQMLYNAKKKLENLFGILAIWFAVTASLVLCSLMFQLRQGMKVRATLLQYYLLIFYVVLKTVQIFTFTFYGNAISEGSENCLNSIYNSGWPDEHDKNFRNDILMILVQRPIKLMAKGWMIIQLDMFAKIMNTSVSYFFLLQTLEEGSQ